MKSALEALAGGGEMGALMRAKDWSKTVLGPVESWPQSLRTTVSTCLNSRFPILIWWGRDKVKLYNDAYRELVGNKHPRSLGAPAIEVWPEIWHIIGPMLDAVYERGESTWSENQLLELERHGFAEECYFTFAYSPIRDETGGVGGIFAAVAETTGQVIGERRLKHLQHLARGTAGARTAREACERGGAVLRENSADLPFALLYLLDASRNVATLASASGDAEAPAELSLDDANAVWPIAEVAKTGVAKGARSALVLPVGRPGERPVAVLVAGVSARLTLDEKYRSFLELVAGQLATAIASAGALEEARRRAEALAELDRAKTAFFSNVSHEFRTPLTLMLGPTEDALRTEARALSGPALETVYRNELRLLKLVNALLDFSRLEAGRATASYEPTDLAVATADLASAFRAAVEKAGLKLEVDCPPLPQPAHVDRAMWEKIVLNLLSNAFKFTFEGGIRVAQRLVDGQVELQVQDSGVGIAAAELPRVFERFHRIEGTRARTHEGSGIGLALVHSLVELHGGTITVRSTPGQGTTFTVRVPLGTAHLPAAALTQAPPRPSGAQAFVEEALRLLPAPAPAAVAPADDGLVLIADDNADMREYMQRLLAPHWRVLTAVDGAEALRLLQTQKPDLLLTDVMMPNLDGFGLLAKLRADPGTARLPVIMLSARAGEEAVVEGIEAGADDYLVKPFSARELLSRVRSQLALSRGEAERAQLLARELQLRRQAEVANLAKDQFLAMLGHELRNPLAPIKTTLEVMRLRGDHKSDRERAIIERQVNHLVRLVDDLLDISRITRGKTALARKRVELAEIVARAIEMASPLLEERRHTLVVEVPREGLAVDGDPDRLAQVVSNLLNNAAKYTEKSGRVAVTAQRQGAQVVLTVSDEGMGIAPQLLPNVFDIFVQEQQASDRARGGMGLGLTIVKSLVELHGGTVSAHSEGRGQGSTFTVKVPAAVTAAVVPEPGRRLPQRRPAGRRVLVVDDNLDAAEMLAEFLDALGYSSRVALDGPAALRIAADFAPEVALLDIGLPVMDGYELAARLKADVKTPLRLIALTGYGQESDRERTKGAGFQAHLVKPIDLDHLSDLLGRLDPLRN